MNKCNQFIRGVADIGAQIWNLLVSKQTRNLSRHWLWIQSLGFKMGIRKPRGEVMMTLIKLYISHWFYLWGTIETAQMLVYRQFFLPIKKVLCACAVPQGMFILKGLKLGLVIVETDCFIIGQCTTDRHDISIRVCCSSSLWFSFRHECILGFNTHQGKIFPKHATFLLSWVCSPVAFLDSHEAAVCVLLP